MAGLPHPHQQEPSAQLELYQLLTRTQVQAHVQEAQGEFIYNLEYPF